ncbi:PREDICTED: zona pellucida sperm-binding protein 2 [Gavialis gangeticus]|uniref:zona pellucida sperm-binding protein 2 n=1 Tax=Gavialis gangeticus TaxID=94835 RepID=UPI00092E2AC4|nr:PREDICTED: zona pellucida sperm-binding protein 2 [Gavialis gangeticus]
MLPLVWWRWCSYSMRLLLLFVCLMVSPTLGAHDPGGLDFPGTVSCHPDKMLTEFPREFRNNSWQVHVVDSSGKEIVDCAYVMDNETLVLTTPYVNCTQLEHEQHKLKLMINWTDAEEDNVTYSIGCDVIQADDIVPPFFTGATNCTKDFMAVAFPRLIPSFHDEYMTAESPVAWTLSIDEGTRTHRLSLGQAMQQGYTFITDGHDLIFQVSFGATGVLSYKQDDQVVYTVAVKLAYGPPQRRLTVESRMICAPGPVTCNSTHMTITIPAFPGTLTAVGVEDQNVPRDRLQANRIALDTKKGIKLHINKRILKSKPYGENCLGLQFYMSSMKLTFNFHGEMVSMVTYPACPCDQPAPVAAVCTQDGHMNFEVLADRTNPPLDLDTLRLRDPTCKPVFKSPSNDMVRFHVPLNKCGTRQMFEGGRIIYENEVSSLWADLALHIISRDSEFRLTVACSYSNDDASLSLRLNSLPPPVSSINQGPLSLLLLTYPDNSYMQPYSDDQYPIVKYLRQPIFLELQVLNRNDPNLHVVLDDCWATASEDPSSLPRWNIVVDGCDYELDSYRTVFHPVGLAVSYPNYRQRFEVKTFTFVSGDTALISLVYFHCSALLCNRLEPDFPLCTKRCPLSRSKRDAGLQGENSAVVSLPGPVLLVPREWSATQERTRVSKGTWTTITVMAAVILCAMAMLLVILFKSLKKRAVVVNAVC